MITCNFCGKSQNQAKKMIANTINPTNESHICDECVYLCLEILNKKQEKGADEE